MIDQISNWSAIWASGTLWPLLLIKSRFLEFTRGLNIPWEDIQFKIVYSERLHGLSQMSVSLKIVDCIKLISFQSKIIFLNAHNRYWRLRWCWHLGNFNSHGFFFFFRKAAWNFWFFKTQTQSWINYSWNLAYSKEFPYTQNALILPLRGTISQRVPIELGEVE